MTDITEFVSKKSREEGFIDRFNRLFKKAKSKKKIRELEMKLLKPKPIRKYRGGEVSVSSFKKRSLLLVFKNETSIQRISRLIRVNTYQQNNTYDVEPFLELISLLETGRLIWNKKKNKYYLKTRDGRKLRI